MNVGVCVCLCTYVCICMYVYMYYVCIIHYYVHLHAYIYGLQMSVPLVMTLFKLLRLFLYKFYLSENFSFGLYTWVMRSSNSAMTTLKRQLQFLTVVQ